MINQKDFQERDRQEQSGKPEPGVNEFVPTPGVNYTMRVLPRDLAEYNSPEGANDFAYKYKLHYKYIKKNGEAIFNTICPKTLGPQHECPVCVEGWALYNSTAPGDRELARKLYHQQKALINIIDIGTSEGVAKGIQWWRSPAKKVYEEIKKYLISTAWVSPNGKDILDLTEGRNFDVRCISEKESGTGFQDYSVQPFPNVFDIKPYLTGDWEARLNNLKTKAPAVLTVIDIRNLLGMAAPAASPPPPAVAVAPAPGVGAPPPVAPAPGVGAPPPVAPAAPAPGVGAPPPVAPAAPAPGVGAPPSQAASVKECFGKYAPRTPECMKCTEKPACKKKFLESDA